ncbi:MAG: methyltransferase domain-containing protein [Pseudomonadota bacterium]
MATTSSAAEARSMADITPPTDEAARKTVLHVGCGQNRIDRLPAPFQSGAWRETRLDVNPEVEPDIVCSMTDMAPVVDASVDAVFSSHNVEHLYPHEVSVALSEFARVLKPTGFAVITCPDLQAVAAIIAEGRLDEAVYTSPAGPISPIDILYGFRREIARGNHFMAHKTGFTLKSLAAALGRAGFQSYVGLRRPRSFDLWMIATKAPHTETDMKRMLAEYVR